MRILLADQDPTAAERLRRTLPASFQLDAVDSKADCLDHFLQDDYDLVIAAERLTDGSGLELLSQVGSRWPETLRIFAAEPGRLRLLRGKLTPFKLFRTVAYPLDERMLLPALTAAQPTEESTQAAVGPTTAPARDARSARKRASVRRPWLPAPEAPAGTAAPDSSLSQPPPARHRPSTRWRHPPQPAGARTPRTVRFGILAAVGIVVSVSIGVGAWSSKSDLQSRAASPSVSADTATELTSALRAPPDDGAQAGTAQRQTAPLREAAQEGRAPRAPRATPAARTFSGRTLEEMGSGVAPGLSKGDAAAVFREARLIAQVAPLYPAEARKDAVAGYVELRFTVSAQGNVEDDIEIVQAEPKHLFAAAAIAAVRRWKYAPQVSDGTPLPSVQHVHLDFRPD